MEIHINYDENANNKITELYFHESHESNILNNAQFETTGTSNLILFAFDNVEKGNNSIKCRVKKQAKLFIISFSQSKLNKYNKYNYAIINMVEFAHSGIVYTLRFNTNIHYTFATNQISTK